MFASVILHMFSGMGNPWVPETRMGMGMGTELYPCMGMGFLMGTIYPNGHGCG